MISLRRLPLRSLLCGAAVLVLAACGGQSNATPAAQAAAAYPSDGALALAGAPSALRTPKQRVPVQIDARVWSGFALYDTQVNLVDDGRRSGLAVAGGVYLRLNTRDPNYDYFLLDMAAIEQVWSFNGCAYDAARASRYCEWVNGGFTMETYLSANGVQVGTVVDDSPRGRIDTRYVSATVGASLGNEISCEAGWTPGVMVAAATVQPCKTPLSAKVTYLFFPESVSGENLTQIDAGTVRWRGDFVGMDQPLCKGHFPAQSTSEGTLGAFAIVRVPRTSLYGQSDQPKITIDDKNEAFNRSYRVAAGSCAGLTTFNHRGEKSFSRTFNLPYFQVPDATRGLRVPSDGTVSLVTISHVTYDIRGLTPSLQLQSNGATIDPKSVGLTFTPDAETASALASNSPSSFPSRGVWTIAARNATKGTYTILVDTAPGGQADSLRSGPIAVTLTVE